MASLDKLCSQASVVGVLCCPVFLTAPGDRHLRGRAFTTPCLATQGMHSKVGTCPTDMPGVGQVVRSQEMHKASSPCPSFPSGSTKATPIWVKERVFRAHESLDRKPIVQSVPFSSLTICQPEKAT
jgi:hypothetical protein